jgi:CRP-like cAMP-binding protein
MMQMQPVTQSEQSAEYLKTLQNGVIFQGLSQSELETIYQVGKLQHYEKDVYIFHEDEVADTISVLVHGVVHLSQLTPKGQQVIMHYLSPGDEIGILALFPNQVYPVTAVSATKSILLSWSNQTLTALMKQFPQLALNALQMMTERFVVLQNQYRQLATERAEQRIARTLLKIARKSGKSEKHGIRLTPPPSRQQIAEMTGTTLYTVSRICSQWEKSGLVQTNRRWLFINNKDALIAITEDEYPPKLIN